MEASSSKNKTNDSQESRLEKVKNSSGLMSKMVITKQTDDMKKTDVVKQTNDAKKTAIQRRTNQVIKTDIVKQTYDVRKSVAANQTNEKTAVVVNQTNDVNKTDIVKQTDVVVQREIPRRLASVLPKRDLTLGGPLRTAPKKVFLPNLNVVRNKNLPVKTSKDTTTRNTCGRQRGGAVRGSHNSKIIQSMGIFSEGIRGVRRKAATRNNREDFSLYRFTKEANKKSPEKSKNKIFECDDDSDDSMPEFDDIDILPVFSRYREIESKRKLQFLNLERRIFPNEPKTIEELLASEKTHVFLMELPLYLPYLEEIVPPPVKKPQFHYVSKNREVPKRPHVTTELDEGEIGRLVRFKSGKIIVYFGKNELEVMMISEKFRYQDLMSISANTGERTAKLINMGPLNSVIKAAPDWKFLLLGKGATL